MRKKEIALLCSMTSLIATSAYCADGPYLSGNVGLARATDATLNVKTVPYESSSEFDFKNGFLVTGAFGYRFSDARLEGEIGYQTNDYDDIKGAFGSGNISGDASALSFMANGYYDFFNDSYFSFFITAGLGIAQVEYSDIGYTPGSGGYLPLDDSDGVFAWQLGAGVGYAFSEQLTLDFKYRYFDTDEADFDIAKAEFASHNFTLGVRYSF